MKGKIIDILHTNNNVTTILNIFKEEFMEAYHSLDSDSKETIMLSRDAAYRKWLYSPLLQGTYLNPSYLINNIAQQNIKGNYVITPKINIIEKENGEIEFEDKFLYYSLEEHEIFNDIKVIIDFADPIITVKGNSVYGIEEGEKIAGDLSFRSAYYITYLVEIMAVLGLIEEIKAIGCKCYTVNIDKYNEFNELDNREKISKVVEISIYKATENFQNAYVIPEMITRDEVVKLLNNGVSQEQYFELINNIPTEIINHINNIDNVIEPDDDEGRKAIEHMQKITGESVSNIILGDQIKCFTDMYLTSVFGYFLGIIMPNYGTTLLLKDFVYKILSCNSSLERTAYLFSSDTLHDLTPLGEYMMFGYGIELNDRFYKTINKQQIVDILEKMVVQRAELKEQWQIQYNIIQSGEFDLDSMIDMLGIPGQNRDANEPLENHLESFFEYMIKMKNLKEATAESHMENIFIFLDSYIQFEDAKKLNNRINSILVENYLSSWYIKHMATSKTDVKNQATSISQYISYLNKVGLLDPENFSQIKETIKDKQKYVAIYEEQFNQDNKGI